MIKMNLNFEFVLFKDTRIPIVHVVFDCHYYRVSCLAYDLKIFMLVYHKHMPEGVVAQKQQAYGVKQPNKILSGPSRR